MKWLTFICASICFVVGVVRSFMGHIDPSTPAGQHTGIVLLFALAGYLDFRVRILEGD